MSVFVSTDVTSGARPSIPTLVAQSVAGSVVLFLILSVSDTVLALLILRSVLAAHPFLLYLFAPELLPHSPGGTMTKP